MNTLSKAIVLGVAVIVALWGTNLVKAAKVDLDGKTFVARTGEPGKEATGEDELKFENGKLYSVGCAKWGFDESDYTTTMEGNRITFVSEMTSPKHGKIVWQGTVKGETIDATYVWTKKRWYWKDAHKEKWLKGTLKK